MEKSNGHDHCPSQDGEESADQALSRLRTANSVSMSPELFEKLYLQTPGRVKGDLRQTFANPTPLGLVGFVVGLTPLSCCLIGWRGAGGLGAADIGVFFFIGGPCQVFAGLLEFLLGNTFPFVVFTTYGGVFFALGGTLQPFYNSAGAYSPTGSFAEGLTTPAFNASYGFFPLAMVLLNLYFVVCSLRINTVFTLIFVGAGIGFALLTGAFWAAAEGSAKAATLMTATGGTWFATALFAWYLLFIQLSGCVGYTLPLPVGHLARLWEKKKNH